MIIIRAMIIIAVLCPFESWSDVAVATIDITGRIIGSPCIVDTNTVTQTIELKKAYAHNLTSGTGSEWVPFQLSLSKCPANWTFATVTFTGPAAADDNYFANTSDAKGVVLQISDSGHIKSYGNGDELTESVDENRSVTFPLEARMFNPGGVVTGGGFSAVVQVDFTYQ